MNHPAKQQFRSVTNRLLAIKFLAEFMLIYPIIPIMYAERGHVDARGVGFIFGLGLALSVLLEVPTGVIADKIPRKYVLLFSLALKTSALFVWLTMPYLAGFLLAATLFALSDAFESGTLQAYLYGVLDGNNKRSFGKFWARVSAMIMVSYTLAYILTTIIGIKYNILILLSAVPCIGAFLLCLTLPKDDIAASHTEVKPKIFATAVAHIKQSPQLISLMVGGILVVPLAKILIEYLSLYYQQAGVATRWVPLIMAGGNILGAILFWSLHRWDKFLANWRLPLLVVFCLIFTASFRGGTASAVVGALFFVRFLRLLQVQYDTAIQHLANDQARATISSISSFFTALVGAALMILVGLTAHENKILAPLRVILLAGAATYFIVGIISQHKPTQARNLT